MLDDDIETVLSTERAWTEAHRHGDTATIARLMAPDYAKIQPDGTVIGREAALASYAPEERLWEIAQGDEYDVRVYGDTAVVIGRWTARGVNHGVRFDYRARFLSVYVRRDGTWQMVAEQSTEITAPPPLPGSAHSAGATHDDGSSFA
jgi:ketosteroid isomerase-like protein